MTSFGVPLGRNEFLVGVAGAIGAAGLAVMFATGGYWTAGLIAVACSTGSAALAAASRRRRLFWTDDELVIVRVLGERRLALSDIQSVEIQETKYSATTSVISLTFTSKVGARTSVRFQAPPAVDIADAIGMLSRTIRAKSSLPS